jgi:hypothetical protein
MVRSGPKTPHLPACKPDGPVGDEGGDTTRSCSFARVGQFTDRIPAVREAIQELRQLEERPACKPDELAENFRNAGYDGMIA